MFVIFRFNVRNSRICVDMERRGSTQIPEFSSHIINMILLRFPSFSLSLSRSFFFLLFALLCRCIGIAPAATQLQAYRGRADSSRMQRGLLLHRLLERGLRNRRAWAFYFLLSAGSSSLHRLRNFSARFSRISMSSSLSERDAFKKGFFESELTLELPKLSEWSVYNIR